MKNIKRAYLRERRKRTGGRDEARPEERKETKEKRSSRPFRPEGPVDVGRFPELLRQVVFP